MLVAFHLDRDAVSASGHPLMLVVSLDHLLLCWLCSIIDRDAVSVSGHLQMLCLCLIPLMLVVSLDLRLRHCRWDAVLVA